MGSRGKGSKANKKELKFQKKILRFFKQNPTRALNYKQLSSVMGAEDNYEKERIVKSLSNLRSKGILVEVSKGKYTLNIKDRLMQGRFHVSKFGKLSFQDNESKSFFTVKTKDSGLALNGDIVQAKLFRDGRRRRRFARVESVIERSKTEYVGKIQNGNDHAFVIPVDPRVHVDFFISKVDIDKYPDGSIVKIIFDEWRSSEKSPRANVVEYIGIAGTIDVEMRSILIEKGFDLDFSAKALGFLDGINETITDEERKSRRDFTKVPTFTIDPVDAKDFDDALSVIRLENGNWEIGIHIADVTHFLEEKSTLDKEAFYRSTSVYFPNRVLPMLPEKLSNHLCSLVPKEERRCFSAVFEIDSDNKVVNEWYGKTLIFSDHRFTYEEAQKNINDRTGLFYNELYILNKLAKTYRNKRLKAGAIAFESREARFSFNDNGKPERIYIKERVDSHKLVEEFMLLANRKVAEFLRKKDVHDHNVYRVHDIPDEEKLSDLIRFVRSLGHSLTNSSPVEFGKSLNTLMKKTEGSYDENIIQHMAVRSMPKALYTSKNIGHFGLAFDHYTHFTSPIRRYADVLVHRKLYSILNKGVAFDKFQLEERCEHISKQEKKAMEAERTATKFMKVLYMQDKIGQTFKGIISGIMEWGFFVEIIENTCEGAVRIADCLDEPFYLDPAEYCFTGHYTGKKYRIGDEVSVIVKAVDIDKKTIDFKLI